MISINHLIKNVNCSSPGSGRHCQILTKQENVTLQLLSIIKQYISSVEALMIQNLLIQLKDGRLARRIGLPFRLREILWKVEVDSKVCR